MGGLAVCAGDWCCLACAVEGLSSEMDVSITMCQRLRLPPVSFSRAALFLHGPLGGDSATPCQSRGWAPCRNRALLSKSRPKTRSGNAWCRWAFFASLRFAAFAPVSLGFAALRLLVVSSFRPAPFRSLGLSFRLDQGWSYCKSSNLWFGI